MQYREPVRLIATDIDGTLLASDGTLPPDNVRAIREAQSKGIIVAIASGRYVENAYLVLEEHGISCPIIAVNGAKITDEKLHVLSQDFMTPESAAVVFQVLCDANATFFIFGKDELCVVPQCYQHSSELSQGDRVQSLGYGFEHGMEAAKECVIKPVNKFYICDAVPLAPIREKLSQISGILLTQSGPHNIEVMPEGIDKGYGVRKLAALYQIPLTQVMTLGDQENDIPMLKAAGYGIAMGNASKETKAAAHFITDTNDQCGFARAVERFALNQN